MRRGTEEAAPAAAAMRACQAVAAAAGHSGWVYTSRLDAFNALVVCSRLLPPTHWQPV